MTTHSKIHRLRLAEWASVIKAQSESGLSVKDWCSANNVSRDKYFYWKRLLKDECLDLAPNEIVPVAGSVSLSPACDSAALKPQKSQKLYESCDFCSGISNPVSLLLGDIRIEIPSSVSDIQAVRLIKAVRHA